MLLDECATHGAQVQLRTEIYGVEHGDGYQLKTSAGDYNANQLVIACGGLSMPKLGATPFGYQVAEQFGHSIVPVRAGLVPFTLHEEQKQRFGEVSGISVPVTAASGDGHFKEAMLFTHRGLSGPAVLQISSYWQPGEAVSINLLPDHEAMAWLQSQQQASPKMQLSTLLQTVFPKRLSVALIEEFKWPGDKRLADINKASFSHIAENLNNWQLKPNGTEGYRTAEVTLGGVNVDEVSSKTMESKHQPGLYFIGEVLDVTGWLGGYNFQWAWASAYAAAEAL